MRFIRIVGWEGSQSYSGRTPPWIRLYNELLDDYRWGRLSDAGKGHFLGLCLLASRTENLITADQAWIAGRIQATSPVDVDELVALGFIEVCDGHPEGAEPPPREVPKTREKEVEKTRAKTCAKTGAKTRTACRRKTQSKRRVVSSSKGRGKELLNALFLEQSRVEQSRAEKSEKEDARATAETPHPPGPVEKFEGKFGQETNAPGLHPPAAALTALPPAPVTASSPAPPCMPAGGREPAPGELAAYAASIGYAGFDPESFLARYRSVGWRQNGDRITDWRPLVNRWQIAEREKARGRGGGGAADVGQRLVLDAMRRQGG